MKAGTVPSSCVSLRQLLEEFLRAFLSFVLAQFALGIWYNISFVVASGSHCSGCFVYESWILREMTFLRGCNAWFFSGYMFCVSTLVALEECSHFLRGGRLVS